MDKYANYECEGQISIFDYEKRETGEMTTLETRADAHETVNKQKRYSQIIASLLVNGHMTAKECAVYLQKHGDIPTAERNYTAPRLTELSINGVVEPIGKKKCQYTGKSVAVYSLTKDWSEHTKKVEG